MRRFVLGIAMAVTSLLPTIGLADDQQIADFIKDRLLAEQRQGNLKGFNVDMRVEKGIVTFEGHVSNEQQERLILTTAQQAGHLGVIKIVDDIEVIETRAQVSAAQPASFQQHLDQQQSFEQQPSFNQSISRQPVPQQNSGAPMAFASANLGKQYGDGDVCHDSGMGMSSMGMQPMGMQPMGMQPMGMQPMGMQPMGMQPMGMQPMGMQPMGMQPMGMEQPMSMGGMGMGGVGGGVMESPNLPGYAWPGYAASPNYAAVNYPKQYSPSAWPYIGPFYPYPQVPLGWRKVTLQWDDGWWFLDFHDK